MAEPSISVAMCTWNGERFLRDQLESIARQSRLPDELVVCDDRSTDRTLTIVSEFAGHAPFAVRIFEQSENVGPWRNFEHAVSLCSGEVIFLSDQDDVWFENKIDVMTQVLLNEPDAGGVFSNAQVVGPGLEPRSYSFWDACGLTPALQARFCAGEAFAALLDGQTIQGASLAFPAAYRPIMLPFSHRWPHDLWIAVILAACSRFILIDDKLMKYRQHGSNVHGAPPPLQRSRLRTIYNKLRNVRGYYRNKRALLDEALHQLDDLQARIDAQGEPDRFARPLQALAVRRARLKDKRQRAVRWLEFLGEDSAISTGRQSA